MTKEECEKINWWSLTWRMILLTIEIVRESFNKGQAIRVSCRCSWFDDGGEGGGGGGNSLKL